MSKTPSGGLPRRRRFRGQSKAGCATKNCCKMGCSGTYTHGVQPFSRRHLTAAFSLSDSALDPFTGKLCFTLRTLANKRGEVKKVMRKAKERVTYASSWKAYGFDSDNPDEVLQHIVERAGKWYLRRREVAAAQTKPWPYTS